MKAISSIMFGMLLALLYCMMNMIHVNTLHYIVATMPMMAAKAQAEIDKRAKN